MKTICWRIKQKTIQLQSSVKVHEYYHSVHFHYSFDNFLFPLCLCVCVGHLFTVTVGQTMTIVICYLFSSLYLSFSLSPRVILIIGEFTELFFCFYLFSTPMFILTMKQRLTIIRSLHINLLNYYKHDNHVNDSWEEKFNSEILGGKSKIHDKIGIKRVDQFLDQISDDD